MSTKEHKSGHYSRREFLSAALAVPFVVAEVPALAHPAANEIKVVSPDGQVRFELVPNMPNLAYRITFRKHPLIDSSPMGLILDGINLGQGISTRILRSYRLREKYPSRGVHSEAINYCTGVKISVTHADTKTRFTLEARAYKDGIAFRYLVPGSSKARVPDEATTFRIPPGTIVWYHDFHGHYEGIHERKEISEVKSGEWVAPPLTLKLPGSAGYAAITEAALINYSGMGLESDGQGSFSGRLGHALPVSYPFELRYKVAEAKRLSTPAALSGPIVTPWRVIMIGADLNTLVNCDIIQNVSPRPDKKIFPAGPNTAWTRPGRCLWRYLDGGQNSLDGMKEFSRLAGELGFEYNMVEGFWQRWPESQMLELVDYAKQYNVGTWFWKHSRDLRTPYARRQFFELCNRLGVVGAKIDFFDHEAKEIIDLYHALLREAAVHKLMVEFHGANKPAGEAHTWPNEMTREAVRGLEYRRMETRSRHNTTLPFTRFLAGHADYTPMHFGERRRETSWAHQIASAAIFTSPLQIYAAHPTSILTNPAVELIKTIPSVWDETVVLPVSEIGAVAAFARRRGKTWFLAIMNGPTERSINIMPSFLSAGSYHALIVRDRADEAAAVELENSRWSKKDLLPIEMRAGGGYIARFQPV
jgi:alpha-glucosidase